MMSFWGGLGTSLFLVILAIFVFFQNLPIFAKDLIAKELKRLRDCSESVEPLGCAKHIVRD